MLRSTFIYLSKADWARNIVMNWDFARRAASRFVAGETLEEAIGVVGILNQNGINATLDHLGEHTNSLEAADKATRAIFDIADAIHQSGVRANISIKLTQIGLAIDQEACAENLRQILSHAKGYGIFVRVDMEDSIWTEATLALFRQMRDEYQLTNSGVVIQAYLYRSEEDVKKLAQESVPVRLCKGAYKEPAEVAFPKKKDVDTNYDLLAAILIDGAVSCGKPQLSDDGCIPPLPAIASHDPERLDYARNYAEKAGLPKIAIEFQMLYGIRRDLQEQMVNEGYPVRVYVPYGTEWYPYFVRRLAERPANLWFFISNYFRR
jgi:proline dehydrogenase